ncbi:uncharacterized protein LOC125043148 [Penaeus chinensis]|uniref:uncharacterized protein LOC125043148 n=1 Tax=Penaeus chinensis TaxID=139456 RepID=UPI001FB65AE6|nr:uncharacterized protein LOC125043148 [Penaeus chinensis]
MQVESTMDEEGYPLASLEQRLESEASRGLLSRCHESGEAAYCQIQVIRRPPAGSEVSSPSVRKGVFERPSDGLALCAAPRFSYSRRKRFRIDHALSSHVEELHSRTLYQAAIRRRALHVKVNSLSLDPQLHQDMSRVLHIPANQGCLCNDPACPTVSSPPGDVICRNRPSENPRVMPSPTSANKPKEKRREVYISIWKELFLGEAIFDAQEPKIPDPRYRCLFKSSKWAKFVPFFLLKLLHFLFIILRVCLPSVSITGFYYLRVYKHQRIHQVGEERGIEPVFTGKVYHGPIIYGVRMLTCPFCREKSASKISLKYFESTYRERKEAAVR